MLRPWNDLEIALHRDLARIKTQGRDQIRDSLAALEPLRRPIDDKLHGQDPPKTIRELVAV